jgi:hypothetical protein
MTRLAAFLAAATLGTGCVFVEDECDRSFALEWTLVDLNGASRACGYSGVQFIDVWINGGAGPVSTFDCSVGAGVVPLAEGTNDVVVEGVDDFGVVVLRDRFVLDGSGCGHAGTFLAEPAEGVLNVLYTLPGPGPSGVCFSPGPSFMWVRAWDDIASTLAIDPTVDPEQLACGSTISFRLPVGSYTLLDTHEVIRSGPEYAAAARSCSDVQFTVGAARDTDVPVDLVGALSFCP